MPKPQTVPQHAFRQILDELGLMSPRQIEDLLDRAFAVRSGRLALGVIEARAEARRNCPHCGHERRQKWGTTRTGVQRFRCMGCGRTYSGLTGTAVCGLHRPDQFLEAIDDMLSDQPLSCRKLAARLKRTKDTIWRWRMMVLEAITGASAGRFEGVVEADETFQRESRKGSREWARHKADPASHPQPPRLQWHRYKSGRLKMQRGLSRWQLPLLTVMDRGGSRFLERIPDRRSITIDAALWPVVAPDAVLCSDGAAAYTIFARKHSLAHFQVHNAPGKRLATPAHHIQNVNALHSRYKAFIRPFKGPASKYLEGYLRWFLVQNERSAGEVFAAMIS